MSTSAIDVRGLRKAFGDLQVLDDLSLHVERGEFVSILGPSGCGKSTILSVLNGTEPADSGELLLDGEPLNRMQSPFAWMPQHDVLFPWRTVEQNVALGGEVAGGLSKREALAQARALLPTFGLDEFGATRPYQLSGGMRQRAAFARTVAQGRDILLLDEPFGALDALTRTELQLWLEQIWGRERWTVVLITHDVREAVLLSDRVYVLGPRATGITLELEIPLPRPRSLELLGNADAAALERELLQALHAGRTA
ncbi:MAG: ABC transporter ATP-binding protein [Actinobacteria bacterium]|nr:ABC transporter ATP-binding protein [Actinomycetota bacterium]